MVIPAARKNRAVWEDKACASCSSGCLATFAGAPIAIAKGLSFVVAGAAAYFGNKHFTYRRKAKGASSVILYAML